MHRRTLFTFSVVLLILFPLSILLWHRAETRPSSLDETKHMQLAMDYRDWIVHRVPLTNPWAHVYPPVYHYSILPLMSVGIPSETKAALSNTLYLIILIVACVLLSRAQGCPEWEGVAAAILTTGYAYVQWVSRRALIDFSLMAWVTLTIALLVRTKGFSDRNASLFWGVATGLGLLIKPPFAFFLAGPILWTLATGRRGPKKKNFIAAAALALVIGGSWYFWQGAYFLDKASGLVNEKIGASMDPHTMAGWFYYLRILLEQMGLGSLIFSAVGIVLLLTLGRRKHGNAVLWLWFLSGYLILSMIINKDPRHSLPMLPALALLAVRGWSTLAGKFRWGPSVLVGVSLLFMGFNSLVYDKPVREDWKHEQIGAIMAKVHDPAAPFLSASLLAQHARFFARSLKWSLRRPGIPLKTISCGDADTSFAEFLIARSGDQGNETALIQGEWKELKPNTRAFQTLFLERGRFPLPDGSEAILYGRQPHPHFNVYPLTTTEVARRLARTLGRFVQSPLTVTVEASPQGLKEGRLSRIHISGGPCMIQGVRADKVDLVVEKPWINLYRLWDENRLGLLAFEAMKPTLQVSAGQLTQRLASIKELSEPHVECREGKLYVQARLKRVKVSAVAHVEIEEGAHPNMTAVLDRISIAGIPLPGWILGKAHHQTLPLEPVPTFPGRIQIQHVNFENNLLSIS